MKRPAHRTMKRPRARERGGPSTLVAVVSAVVVALSTFASAPYGASATPSDHAPIAWSRSQKDPRWVEGTVTVDASLDAVWARLVQVADWARLFSDTRSIEILESKPNASRVTIDSRILDNDYEWWLRFFPKKTITLTSDTTGFGVHGTLFLSESKDPGTGRASTRAIFRLFAQSEGVLGALVSESYIRTRQQRILVSYLRDLRNAFRTRPHALDGNTQKPTATKTEESTSSRPRP